MEADVVPHPLPRQPAPARFAGAEAAVREIEALRSIPGARGYRAAAEQPAEAAGRLVRIPHLPAVAAVAVHRLLRRGLIRLLPAVIRRLPVAAALVLPSLPVVSEADVRVAAVAADKSVVG